MRHADGRGKVRLLSSTRVGDGRDGARHIPVNFLDEGPGRCLASTWHTGSLHQ